MLHLLNVTSMLRSFFLVLAEKVYLLSLGKSASETNPKVPQRPARNSDDAADPLIFLQLRSQHICLRS